MEFNFLQYSKKYFVFSGTLVLASLICLGIFGLNFGIDFTGGSILELEYAQDRPSNQEIKDHLAEFELGEIYVQPTEERGVILRLKDIDEDTHQNIVNKLRQNQELQEQKFETIGPVIGKELKEKTKIVIILSLLAIVFYIAFAFRKIKRPLKSWQYGLVALVALFHDVVIPIGVLSILGKFYGIQVTIPVIVALLAVVGYSINDTVVIFDRIRENLLKKANSDFKEIVNISLNQTIVRSLNTSITTLLVVSALFFLGGETLKPFALTLMFGIIAGTYSSIFLAPPLLTRWLRR
jgi:preprotein translocase subunit SecF